MTPRSSGGTRLHPPPKGGKRGADQTSPWLRGGASLHPPLKVEEEVIHNRLSGTRGQKKGRQKRGASLHFSPPLRAGSVVISTNTLSTGGSKNDSFATPQSFESPQFDCINVGRETFLNDDTDKEYKCSHCLEPYLACNFVPKNPSLPFLVC